MIFQYRAKNKTGESFIGLVESINIEEATSLLKERDLIVISLKEKRRSTFGQLKIFSGVKSREIVIFSRQLSVMISASFPLVESLRTVSKQTANQDLKTVIAEVADETEGGNRLSDSLAKYPKIFNHFFINMVRVGESSGKLDEILNYLAETQEKDYDLNSKIKGAMIYPAVILGFAIALGFFMMTFMIPRLSEILKETGAPLPFATKLLMNTSDFFASYWYIIVILVGAIAIFFVSFLKTPEGRKQWDNFKLKVPVFGKFFQKIYLIRFSRSLSTLTEGGLPLTKSLRIVGDVIGNVVYKDLVKRTVKEVEDGNSISSIFLQSQAVPAMFSQMLDVGEQTGRLDDVLSKLANFYDREIDGMITNLMTIIEPVVLILLGIGVGLMVAAFILPMYNLAGSF